MEIISKLLPNGKEEQMRKLIINTFVMLDGVTGS
jgi:hypothetical protein